MLQSMTNPHQRLDLLIVFLLKELIIKVYDFFKLINMRPHEVLIFIRYLLTILMFIVLKLCILEHLILI